MSTTAYHNAPRLICVPHFAGQTIVFRSPHAHEVLLVDVAERNNSGGLSYVAANNPALENVALQAYRAMNARLSTDFDTGFFSPAQCRHFCVNHAVRNGKGQPALQAASDAAEWVSRTLALPHEQAVAAFIEAGVMPESPHAACTQELIGRIMSDVPSISGGLQGFLINAYRGHVAAEDYASLLYREIYDSPNMLHFAQTLPGATVDSMIALAERMPTDQEGNFLYNESFIKAGVHQKSFIESLKGFRDGSGLETGVVMATLYREEGDVLKVVLPEQVVNPARLEQIISTHDLHAVELVMTPEGHAPALISGDKHTLLIERIDGDFPTSETLDRLVQRHGLECDVGHFQMVGRADHTAPSPMRMS